MSGESASASHTCSYAVVSKNGIITKVKGDFSERGFVKKGFVQCLRGNIIGLELLV